MKKLIIISFLVLLTNILFGQKSLDYYNKGIELFKKEKYKEADSLLNLAVDNLDDETKHLGANLYFDRGIIRLYLSDTAGFCADMCTSANTFSDKDAENNYRYFCIEYHKKANE